MRLKRSHFVERLLTSVALTAVFCSITISAQQTPPAGQMSPPHSVVPRVMQFSGVLKDSRNKPLVGVVPVTFAIYAAQEDNTALWIETQDVTFSADGNYTALLGAASHTGIPADLFAKGDARWLGIQTPDQPERPRILLVSVPYALKAGDADTLGGLPASAFLTASHATENAAASKPSVIPAPLLVQPASTLATATTGTGTTNFIPLWTSTTNLGNSILFQSSGNLQVNGGLQLPQIGTATATTGLNSRPLDLFSSSYNSSTKAAVSQHFRVQAEPVSNNTTAPSGKLNLLFASSTSTPVETGLSINSKGILTFASGQTLPKVTGNLAVTGIVTAAQLISTGNLNVTGSINSALTIKSNVTSPTEGYTSANLIGGYSSNTVRTGVTGATISGGGGNYSNFPNTVKDNFGTVGGGVANTAGNGVGGRFATVSGGAGNTAGGYASTVPGGSNNTASGSYTVAGGAGNTASGNFSTVPGGQGNTASGQYSFAAGQGANAVDADSFVWCQNSGPCNSMGTNSFVVNLQGTICSLAPGNNGWQCSSDRNLKRNIVPIDSRSVLERVAGMPISQWQMKSDSAGHQHIGPMAQDFCAAFALGDSDKYIAQGDAQGVALASIQGLYRIVQEKDEQIRTLQTQLKALEGRLTRFEAGLESLSSVGSK